MSNFTEMRRRVIQLVASIVVLDAAALAIYYGAHVAGTPQRTQTIFVGTWLVVTLVVVLTGLSRIRALRGRRTR